MNKYCIKNDDLINHWTIIPSGIKGIHYYKCGFCKEVADYPKKYCPYCGARNKRVMVSEVK